MKKYLAYYFMGPALPLILPGGAVAQRSLSVVAAAQAHGMVPRFADDRLVNAQISLSPKVYRSGLVGVAVGLTPELALQATAGFVSYGLAVRRQLDYPGHRYEDLAQSSTRTNALEVALVARRYLTGEQHPNRSWFTDVGIDVLYLGKRRRIGGIWGLNFGSQTPSQTPGPGMSGAVVPVSDNLYRVGIRAGIGHEWALGLRHFVALELLASYGLRDLQRFEMKYTVWNQGPTIDPRKYENAIATRVSFIGLQGRYRFQTSKPTAPRN